MLSYHHCSQFNVAVNLEVLFVGRALYNKQLSQMCNRNLTHLSGNDGYFWDCGLCKSKKQFGSVSDDASVLLSCACWEKTQQFYWIGVQTIRFSTGGLFSLIQLTGESLVVKLNRLNHELQHGKHALHITAACVYMHEDIIQEYLAGSLAHPQTWWWECWKHHRSEQIGLPSLRSWCPNSLTNKTSTKWIEWIEGFFFLTVSYSHIFFTWSYFGLITHNAHSASIHTGKSHHNVFGVVGHDLKEFHLIYYLIKKKNFFLNTHKKEMRCCGTY